MRSGVWLLSRIELALVCFPVAGPVLLPAIAIDGKAVRGAIPAGGQIPFLLAAATHASAATRKAATVVAERLIGAKTRSPRSSRCRNGSQALPTSPGTS
jgi:hypothetical protein